MAFFSWGFAGAVRPYNLFSVGGRGGGGVRLQVAAYRLVAFVLLLLF